MAEPNRAELVKVIERAKTGSPGILADRILESDWLKNYVDESINEVI